jgi:cobyrinic acid a,c-diamide synthase
MTARGVLIAAPRSGSGKTVVTLGLMRALAQRGLAVAGAKCGPDYIDPAFHTAATGRQSLNLDSWAMAPPLLQALATTTAAGASHVLVEAHMGLFDGVPGPAGSTGSSADIAAALGLPVLLVLDVSGQSQSAGAVALGCATFDKRVTVAGVILNKCGSERHIRLASQAIADTGLPVVGAIPRSDGLSLMERHLGLVQAREVGSLDARLDHLAGIISRHVDVDRVVSLTQPIRQPATSNDAASALAPPGQRIALADDAVFSFVYPHVLNGWRAAGAEIRAFSPLADEVPPAGCDVCWLPGGYPELYALELSQRATFLQGLRAFAETRPVHGECGGYMVLGEALETADGVTHRMAGLLGHATSFAKRTLHLGYRDLVLIADGALGAAGGRVRGHEFHYATVTKPGADDPFARASDAYGNDLGAVGGRRGHVSGSFFHAIARGAA